MRKFLTIQVLLVIFSFSLCRKVKYITTLLNAKWNRPPLPLEVSEYMYDINPKLFWQFTDSITNLSTPLYLKETEKEKFDESMNVAAKYLTSMELKFLRFMLSLHIYAPKIEMFNQIARTKQTKCNTFVEFSDLQIVCDLNIVSNKLLTIENQINKNSTNVLNTDHHYGDFDQQLPTVILYSEIGTVRFQEFHDVLKKSSEMGKINYILRHYIQNEVQEKLRLSGYGVELQMKSTEYKVQDDSQLDNSESKTKNSNISDTDDDIEIDSLEGFRFKRLKELYPELSSNLETLKTYVLDLQSEMVALKVWQFQELSLQATEKIMQTPTNDALKEFSRISENFPVQIKFLYKLLVRRELREEVKSNQEHLRQKFGLYPPDTTLFINGIMVDLDSDIFSIVDILKSELQIVQSLQRIGIPFNEIPYVFSFQKTYNPYYDEEESSDNPIAIKFNDKSVYWINDIERDSEYENLQYSPFFRKNLLNLVAFIDPTQKDSLKVLENLQLLHHEGSVPFRYGIVLVLNNHNSDLIGFEDSGIAIFAAFNYIKIIDNVNQAYKFLIKILRNNDQVQVDNVINFIKYKYKKAKLDKIFGKDSKYVTNRETSNDFFDRTDMKSLPNALLNGSPLSIKDLHLNDLRSKLMNELSKWSMFYQSALMGHKLLLHDDVVEFILNQANFMHSLNKRIVGDKQQIHIDLTDPNIDNLFKQLRYFRNPKRPDNGFVMNTIWIVGNLENSKHRTIFINALKFLNYNNNVRVGFILNPTVDEYIKNYYYNKYIIQQLNKDKCDTLSTIIAFLESEKSENHKFENDNFENLYNEMINFSRESLNLNSNDVGIISNGQFFGTLNDNENFKLKDFDLLHKFMEKKYVKQLVPKLKKLVAKYPNKIDDYAIVKLFNLYTRQEKTNSRYIIEFTSEKYSVLNIEARDENEAYLELIGVADPASKNAHKLATILQVLQDVINCRIKVFFNSVEKNSDMPVKSFYRFVLESDIQFDINGKQITGPIAKFHNIPHSPLLTQNLLVPENWLVEVIDSVYDLDNIKLEKFEHSVHSEYELENLLLEGHCLDIDKRIPPRGLQFNLGTQLQEEIVDTIVMANLGYFQLKANPRSWFLKLRDGRSLDVYKIVGVEGSDTLMIDGKINVVLSSFKSKVIRVQVSKKEEMKHVELLVDDDIENGVWSQIANSFRRSDDDEKLNIFSLASGHLYERFLKIMMLSVLKHTKTPVKFWFLKNYLSPQIKKFLPVMAKKYNFEYELVQYKWPKWLHHQTEKQRIIWGYKILFLDVLFPLDVKKIIFVDADQVVRADLKELRDLDLEGAPYGYTPFCDSRKEMDGFRFWIHGYWRNHLRGRKYHISALYVVDLKRFRRIAAGDRLRGQYQQLSVDPNSLSNLDQDLPNNMIYQVAIKSLPQEWLWCETWCDDQSKKYAKTIDLCNNPMTKEAKLDAAVRIIDEWTDYDSEIKNLQEQFDNKSNVIVSKQPISEHEEL